MKTATENIPVTQKGPDRVGPKLVMCNFIPDIEKLYEFAHRHNFTGIDYSFDLESLPRTPLQEAAWVKEMASLAPLEVRYHCPFDRVDLGHDDAGKSREADTLFRRIIRLISKAGGINIFHSNIS